MTPEYRANDAAKPPSMVVVIVCYRVVELTIDCLKSLAEQIRDVSGAQVIVCENGTGPDAVERLSRYITDNSWNDWVTLQAIYPNVGFTGGNNAVLREAMSWPAPPKYFLLLNADTIVQPGALRSVYNAMEQSPDVGIMGTAMVGIDGTLQNSCFRDHSPQSEFLRAAGLGVLNRVLFRDNFPLKPRPGDSQYEWVSFASAVIRTDVIREIGYLDEGFFLYFDDADYCRMARKAGWEISCCREAKVVHLEGQSNSVPESNRRLERRPRYYYVSRARYFAKHLGAVGLWTANLAWLAGSLIGQLKQLVSSKRGSICEREWKDIWTNAWAPVRKSNASLTPKESRIVV